MPLKRQKARGGQQGRPRPIINQLRAEMAKFETKDGQLYIDGQEVIKAWESFTGWYWFATEKVEERKSILPDGQVGEDTIWFGFVQGFFDEWGTWSEAELKELIAKGLVWEIPKQNLPYSGRRDNRP